MCFTIFGVAMILSSCESEIPKVDSIVQVYESSEPDDTPTDYDECIFADLWNPVHFQSVRAPRYLGDETHFGYIAMHHVVYMNDYLYSRAPFTQRELYAAVWIVEELLAMGYTWADIEIQQFHYRDVGLTASSASERNRNYSQNIILTVPGQSSRTIIVCAHYDSVASVPGADDNASGTALLLESAQRMRNIEHYHTLVYVFFGSHENNMLGAGYFVDALSDVQRDNIVFMFAADTLLGSFLEYGTGFHDCEPGNLTDWDNRTIAPGSNSVSRQIDGIANSLFLVYYASGIDSTRDLARYYSARANNDIVMFTRPRVIYRGSDQLIFLQEGFTVLTFLGLSIERTEAGEYTMPFWGHSRRDNIHMINENNPGMPEEALRVFGIFLEAVLLERYI